MSYNFWYNYHPLAGPEHCPSFTNTSSSSQVLKMPRISHIVQKESGGGSDATPRVHQYLTRPHFHFAVGDDPFHSADVVTYYRNERGTHETSALVPDASLEVLRPYCFMGGVIEAPATAPPRSSPVLSFKCHDQQAPPSSPSLPFLEDSPESPPVVTPKLEDPEGFCLDSSSSSLSLSPYAPMPLPPIFTHEFGSKVMPIPIDTTSSYPFWMAHEKTRGERLSEERRIPIDPFLEQSTQDLSLEKRNPFARGSNTAETLWSSAPLAPGFLASAQIQSEQSMFLEVSNQPKDIPLEVAERQAAEFRAAGNNISLSSHFLMQFLGQPVGQTKWHCYIHGCGKKLTRKGHMMDHVRMHLDERSFVCEHCSQTFLRKADCKRHAATHNPTKGFPCDSCPKSYARKDLLTRHARICQSKSGGNYETPALNRNRQQKRKGSHSNGIINSQNTNDGSAAFTSPHKLLLLQGRQINHEAFSQGSDGENKENIDPSTFPSGPMFNLPQWNLRDEGEDYNEYLYEDRRKRAKTCL